LFSKLKSHELSRKGRPNHDAPFSSKALITGAHVDGHVANPTNTTGFNRLCNLKAAWRNVMLSLSFLMARISVLGRTKLATIF
jgi:hypothetical protein